MHTAGGQSALSNHGTKGFLQSEIWQQGSVNRKAASFEERSADKIDGRCISICSGVLQLSLISSLLDNKAAQILLKECLDGAFGNSLPRQEITNETHTLIFCIGGKRDRQSVDAS